MKHSLQIPDWKTAFPNRFPDHQLLLCSAMCLKYFGTHPQHHNPELSLELCNPAILMRKEETCTPAGGKTCKLKMRRTLTNKPLQLLTAYKCTCTLSCQNYSRNQSSLDNGHSVTKKTTECPGSFSLDCGMHDKTWARCVGRQRK